jgi:rhodanese-related sulfurtransferase
MTSASSWSSVRRRLSIILGLLVLAVAGVGPALAQRVAVGTVMTATDAHAKALAGEVVLVDIRTPEEWKDTGVPASAHAVTMHQGGAAFVAGLKQAMNGDTTKPLAIICNSGNRTSSIYVDLQRAGFTNLINVAEGVGGGPFGRGWLKLGLPLRGATVALTLPQPLGMPN